ncbi:hypothetical protein J6590_077422 [Homalodisca vitripennis]|nr:hypothetical protein J6590_077422 [Homalodisca vitripennis]
MPLVAPLTVKLMGQNLPLSAGKEYELACQTSGSRPPATITWWKGGTRLSVPTRVTPSNDGNSSVSRVTFLADVEDLGSSLSCRASNPNVPASALEDSWTLNIHYVPVVGVELGSNINASYIREGMDVYFECSVTANPRVRKVMWIHNDKRYIMPYFNIVSGMLVTIFVNEFNTLNSYKPSYSTMAWSVRGPDFLGLVLPLSHPAYCAPSPRFRLYQIPGLYKTMRSSEQCFPVPTPHPYA